MCDLLSAAIEGYVALHKRLKLLLAQTTDKESSKASSGEQDPVVDESAPGNKETAKNTTVKPGPRSRETHTYTFLDCLPIEKMMSEARVWRATLQS